MITIEPGPLKHGGQFVRALRCHQGTYEDDKKSSIADSTHIKNSSQGQMMRQITFGRINVRQMWNDTVTKFCVGGYDHYVSNNLLQHVIDSLLAIRIRKLKKRREDTSAYHSVPSVLPQEEKEVLHYAIGYTVRKLTKNINLGVIFNKHLNMEAHVKSLCRLCM